MQPSSSAHGRDESCTFSEELDLDCVVTGDFELGDAADFTSLRSIPLRQSGVPALKGTCRLSLWTLEKQNPWVKFSRGDGNHRVLLHWLPWVWISYFTESDFGKY